MDVKEVLWKGIERWNAHDRAGFLELYDEKAIFIDESIGAEIVGREECGRGWYDPVVGAYPDVAIKDPIVFGEGELACLQGLFVGTHTGVFRGPEIEMQPTGKHVEIPFVLIAEVKDGKVKRARLYSDRLRMLEQEGIFKVGQLAQLATA